MHFYLNTGIKSISYFLEKKWSKVLWKTLEMLNVPIQSSLLELISKNWLVQFSNWLLLKKSKLLYSRIPVNGTISLILLAAFRGPSLNLLTPKTIRSKFWLMIKPRSYNWKGWISKQKLWSLVVLSMLFRDLWSKLSLDKEEIQYGAKLRKKYQKIWKNIFWLERI